MNKTESQRAANAFYDSIKYAQPLERAELCQKLSTLTGLEYKRLLVVFRLWQREAVVTLLASRLRKVEVPNAADDLLGYIALCTVCTLPIGGNLVIGVLCGLSVFCAALAYSCLVAASQDDDEWPEVTK